MPRAVLVSTGVLTALAALVGLRFGYIVATVTETDVINTYAARYLQARAEQGETGMLTDCVAWPGDTRGIWIVVGCGPQPHDPARYYEYHVNRAGGLEYSGGPDTWGIKAVSGAGAET